MEGLDVNCRGVKLAGILSKDVLENSAINCVLPSNILYNKTSYTRYSLLFNRFANPLATRLEVSIHDPTFWPNGLANRVANRLHRANKHFPVLPTFGPTRLDELNMFDSSNRVGPKVAQQLRRVYGPPTCLSTDWMNYANQPCADQLAKRRR